MRLLFLVLFVLVGLIQYPLWLGKGGWFKVWDLQRQVAEQRETNEGLRARNAALEAEVRDLEGGTGAIEERARGELGMMREGEVFVQVLPQNVHPPAGGASVATGGAAKPATPARSGAAAAKPSANAAGTAPRH
ncbi:MULTISPECIES: cell division protein FtsB [Achromobacter]|uniref:Cell division protein FtsB n=1 Tax=Achromobacter spanius TaxID=217203 RepID=A0ABY8GST1_9BURK|nr:MULTISPECIES: cell division protein FtsB [Achromobacter]WAI82856.1 cell division protein FtsB [Achromobacter spanius]WEX92940.1 cell division protein FtsB [Achromobacter sp. SS2-2022]WFP07905.1 cell division protein FtsB [Achromobacter spanius]